VIRLNGKLMRQRLERLVEETNKNGKEKKGVRTGVKANGKVS